MALEYPFKMLLYLVVIIVVIGIILAFRKEISSINFCWIWGCQPKACETVRVNENLIDQQVLDKYCNLCWQKTGAAELKEDCICYIVNGSFTPFTYSSEHCELKCTSASQFITFTYSHLFNNVSIEC
jgi:hypothetical protein